jgi:hypothetical protein
MDKKPKHNTGSTVWHYYTGDGELVRRRLQPGQEPEPGWTRGFGPHSAEIREKIKRRTQAVHRNKVVSEHTRALMRAAKLGVPKTMEHRVSMSIAQTLRHRRRRESESK